jgi:hypothetical protein
MTEKIRERLLDGATLTATLPNGAILYASWELHDVYRLTEDWKVDPPCGVVTFHKSKTLPPYLIKTVQDFSIDEFIERDMLEQAETWEVVTEE